MESEMIAVEVLNEQNIIQLDMAPISQMLRRIARDFGFQQGELSLAAVDDPTIHAVNVEHLQHDYPTDVISFVFESDGDYLEGEIIVSVETAIREAAHAPWGATDEILLYFIHGMLHLVGMDDQTEEEAKSMREAERKYLMLANVCGSDQHGMTAWHQWEPSTEERIPPE